MICFIFECCVSVEVGTGEELGEREGVRTSLS